MGRDGWVGKMYVIYEKGSQHIGSPYNGRGTMVRNMGYCMEAGQQ